MRKLVTVVSYIRGEGIKLRKQNNIKVEQLFCDVTRPQHCKCPGFESFPRKEGLAIKEKRQRKCLPY